MSGVKKLEEHLKIMQRLRGKKAGISYGPIFIPALPTGKRKPTRAPFIGFGIKKRF